MKLTEEAYHRLKEEVGTARANADRAKGALDQLMTRLDTEFQCKSLKEAKALLAKLDSRRERTEEEFETAVNSYEKRWKGAKNDKERTD